MISTVLKKTFLQIWDNSLFLFIGNVVLMLFFFVIVNLLTLTYSFSAVAKFFSFAFAVVVIAFLFEIYAISTITFISRDEGLRRVGQKAVWWTLIWSLVCATTGLGISSLLSFLFEFVAGLGGHLQIIITVLLSWVTLVFLQFTLFLMVTTVVHNGDLFGSCRLSLLLVFSKPGFSFLVLVSFILFIITSITIIPGPGGAILMMKNALDLQLQKYPGLIENNSSNKFSSDWEAFLAKESTQSGKRSLNSILFPWKT